MDFGLVAWQMTSLRLIWSEEGVMEGIGSLQEADLNLVLASIVAETEKFGQQVDSNHDDSNQLPNFELLVQQLQSCSLLRVEK